MKLKTFIAFAALVFGLAIISASRAASFRSLSPLAVARSEHTATSLQNGRVLLGGGLSNAAETLASAEIYDPSAGTASPTGSLTAPRAFHTGTLLPDGTVLIACGKDVNGGLLNTAERFNPAAGIWTVTGTLTDRRSNHTATLLPNGKVLVAGGFDESFAGLSSAQLYNPASGTWTPTGLMTAGRSGHTATLLTNGKVLVAGGDDDDGGQSTAELYDPARNLDGDRFAHGGSHRPLCDLAAEWARAGRGRRKQWHIRNLRSRHRAMDCDRRDE